VTDRPASARSNRGDQGMTENQEITQEDKNSKRREAILEALQNYLDEDRLAMFGGYPSEIDGSSIDGYVVAATVHGENEPYLRIYTWEILENWYEEALRHMEEENSSCDDEDKLDFADAFFDTAP
jgi:hypothetical protein